jgi:hypothetical protein
MKYVDISEAKTIETKTYAFVTHRGDSKKFLFEVPEGLTLNPGDEVLCDTMKGECRGTVTNAPFEIDRKTANILSDVLGFYFPIKQITGKIISPDDEMPF